MRVKLESRLTIAEAAEARNALLAALADPDGIEIDASDVEVVDVAGLQVLVAARRSADRAGVAFGVAPGTTTEVIDEAARRAGFFLGAEDRRPMPWRRDAS